MLSCGAFVLSIQVLQSLLDSAGMLHFLHAWSAFTKSHSPYTSIVMPIWAGLVPSHLSQWPQKFHFPSLEAIKIPAEYIPADGHMGLEDTESGYHFYHQNSNADHHLHHFDGLEHSLHDSTSLQSDDHRIMLHSEIRDESFHKNLLGLSNASISLDYLSSLKKSLNVNCNKFEALAALIWRERTRMMDFPPSTEVVLFFPVPMKHDAHLAFYGQYGFNCMVSTHAGNLLQSGINEVVLMIQEARMHYSKQFLNCMRKFCQMHLASKRAPPHALIFTVLWYGAEEIDFGTRVAPAAADATRLPSPVNVIAVTGGLEHTIELAMTNVPADFPDQLSFISYGRSTIRSESKL
ncbi:hypothetical protein KP509_24G039100 [Ceratopteris richardii]|nr:hypothetical protein KP509_24G039100 [Ceratopteris richardii]